MNAFLSKTIGRHRLPAFALALLTLLWGYNWVAMKHALHHAGVIPFSALRFGVATAVLLPVMVLQRQSLAVERRHLPILLFLSALLILNFGCVASALASGAAGKTSVLVYAMPLWVLILSRAILKERLQRWQWIAAGVALVGLVILIDPRHASGTWYSSLLAVFGGVFWAAGVVATKGVQRGENRVPIMTLTLWQSVFGFAGFALMWRLSPTEQAVDWSAALWWQVFYSGVLATAVAWILFNYALGRLPANITSVGTLATPVVGIASAWLELGEQPAPSELLGMAFIMVALAALALVPLMLSAAPWRIARTAPATAAWAAPIGDDKRPRRVTGSAGPQPAVK